MNTQFVNLCIRCGKPRIVTKTWQKGGITYSNSVCPDKECQKIVNADLKKKADRLNLIQKDSLKRRVQNRKIKKKK